MQSKMVWLESNLEPHANVITNQTKCNQINTEKQMGQQIT